VKCERIFSRQKYVEEKVNEVLEAHKLNITLGREPF
jgi:hypothetical protein